MSLNQHSTNCHSLNRRVTDKNYFLVCQKKKPVDFDDELRIGDVRYKHLTQ